MGTLRAAELGNLEDHFQLAKLYHLGVGVEKNNKRETFIMKKQQLVVMQLRFTISQLKWNAGRTERADEERWIVAANLGCNLSLKQPKNICAEGKDEQRRRCCSSSFPSGSCSCNEESRNNGSDHSRGRPGERGT
eukprot:scaffold2515_cov206-Skeletonema_marinoi.AAC.3